MQADNRHRASRFLRGRTYGAFALVAALGVGACTGEIVDAGGGTNAGDTGGSSGSSGTAGSSSTTGTGTPGAGGSAGVTPGTGGAGGVGGTAGTSVVPPNYDPKAAGLRPLTRLSRREYNNTVRDLLGDTTKPATEFPDDKPDDFLFRRADAIGPQDAEVLQSAAGSLAAAATAATKLNALVGCTTADEACARTFVKNFGLKAYRRPVTTAETDRLIALYTNARGKLALGFGDAVNLMVQAMLQSPAFLYHSERAPGELPTVDGAVVRLSPYELASRLSYFIWGSMPDDKLLQAATAGQLGTPAEIEAQAARMLVDAKAQDTIAAFFTELLELDLLVESRPKDAMLYPANIYPATIVNDIMAETAAFTKNVVFQGDGTLATLLGADYSFVNASLAKIYGATAQGTTLVKATLNPQQRLGLLTQTGFLAVNGAGDGSHPVRRGKAIVTKLMCMELPPPPDNVPPAPTAPTAGTTTRQRFTDHGKLDCTGSCHKMMDPLGYAFEHYDGIGKFRTVDNGGMVDSSTSFPLDGKTVTVADAPALAKVLAASPTVQNCVATQFVRYALARNEVEQDGATLAQAQSAFAKNGFKLQDLMVGIASSRSFQYRTPASDEVLK